VDKSTLCSSLVITVVSFTALQWLYRAYKRREMFFKIRRRYLKARRSIEHLREKLSEIRINKDVLSLNFSELQKLLQSGELGALEVLQAYQTMALNINEEINAITDVIESATSEAIRLDGVNDRGPLHGIPISVKESVGLKGLDCTAGFGQLADVLKKDDSVLIKVLRLKGAIPFIRTNIPQGMRSFACSNPIYGETKNPLNMSRCPGGSSGGEGAIIGGKGSILGVGSDIGGSLRCPAAFCGICALKPTSSRISSFGNFSTDAIGGQNIVPSAYGPMGRDVTTLIDFMEAVICPEMFSLDPHVTPIPFRHELLESSAPLRIGYYVYDECTRCTPPVVRAVMMAKSLLQDRGHTLVEIKPYKPMYACADILIPALFGDDCDSYADLLKYDTTCEIMYNTYRFNQYPYLLRLLFMRLQQLMHNDPLIVAMMKRKSMRSISDWFRKANECKEYQMEFATRWKKQNLDVVICPCLPCAPPRVGLEQKLLAILTYTGLYNVLNYPSGTLPVTTVTTSDVGNTMNPSYYPAYTAIEKLIQRDCEGSEGLPIGIQVVGLPFTEEVVLRVIISRAFYLINFKEHNFFQTCSHFDLYNVLNYPAGTLPVTTSDVGNTMNPSYYPAYTDIEKLIQRDCEGSEGLPIGIQVVGLPFTEEVVLRVMLELETALKSSHRH
ncbi:fatty-acid amide hydrolase 1, partial [Biomphalaria glabrata]